MDPPAKHFLLSGTVRVRLGRGLRVPGDCRPRTEHRTVGDRALGCPQCRSLDRGCERWPTLVTES
jgi:hypothetical protein